MCFFLVMLLLFFNRGCLGSHAWPEPSGGRARDSKGSRRLTSLPPVTRLKDRPWCRGTDGRGPMVLVSHLNPHLPSCTPRLSSDPLLGFISQCAFPRRKVPKIFFPTRALRFPRASEQSAAKFAPHPIVPEEATRPSAHGPTGVSNARRRAGTDPPPAEEPEPVML